MNFVTADALYMAPLFIIAVVGMLLVLAEAFFTGRDRTALAGLAVAGSLAGAFASIALYRHLAPGESRLLMNDMLVADRTGYALSTLFCVITALTALVSPSHQRTHAWVIGEYYGVLLMTTVGTVMLAHAANLATVFLGVETMSIGVYVMTALRRRSRRGNEAAMKYFLMGAFATGFLLYGMALVYGATGNVSIGTFTNLFNVVTALGQGLDIDGNGSYGATTDGLLVVRYLLGLRGAALISGAAVGAGATRTTSTAIQQYLANLLP